MDNTRRDFIRRGSLFLGAAAFLSPRGLLRGAPLPPGASVSIDPAVLDFVSSYSLKHYIQGGSAVAKVSNKPAPVVSILAQVADLQSLADALDRQHFAQLYAEGDDLSFFQNGTFHRIENVLTSDFSAKLSGLGKGANLNFAHEAVLLDPSAASISDPFGAASSPPPALKRIAPSLSLADDFDLVVKGSIEAGRYRLQPDAAFGALVEKTLLARPASIEVARAITNTWIGSLAPLAAVTPAATMEAIVLTPLVSTSLLWSSGIPSAGVVAVFSHIRSVLPATVFSDASIWLAATLGLKLRVTQGALSIDDPDRYSALLTKEALVLARYIAVSSLFTAAPQPKRKS